MFWTIILSILLVSVLIVACGLLYDREHQSTSRKTQKIDSPAVEHDNDDDTWQVTATLGDRGKRKQVPV